MTSITTDALLDFDDFHQHDLPARLAAGNGALAYDDVAGVGPIAVRLAGTDQAYSYVPIDGTIVVEAGDEPARAVIELDAESFTGLVLDLDTMPGLLYRGRIGSVRGNIRRALRWEAALRAMFHGLPIFDPDAVELLDRDGSPLDPRERFTLDDDIDDLRHFLHTTGYLVLRGVFDEAEITDMLTASERLRHEAVEGDKTSWWGRRADGTALPTRVLAAGREAVFGELHDDERVRQMAALSEFELVPRPRHRDQTVTVLWKLPDMVEGLADIPWHRDCGMGGHAEMCPLMIATVCLTEGSEASGELRVLPGSWRSAVNFMKPDDPEAPQGVGLATSAGDVTLHYSDIMHASMPPTGSGPFRVSALLAFVPPTARGHRHGERSYNDPLLANDDGQVEHLDKIVDRL